MKFATCAIRIYVCPEKGESFCPLPIELLSFCEEGKTMDCHHYKNGLVKSLKAQEKAMLWMKEKGLI